MDVTTLADIGRVTSGTYDPAGGDTPVGPDVVIDSRLVTPGALFVALAGDKVDGHDFVAGAIEAGAAAALVSRPTGAAYEIVVSDPAQALADLARDRVAQAGGAGLQVIGITGSSGKTSTKDLLAQVLEAAGPTVAPQGSFNNEIGVPLTGLRATSGTRFLVCEMGARGAGHIRWLCDVTLPRVGVVLNVGSAHLGEFGGVEQIAQAKGELVEAVGADGWAVLNADDPRVLAMAERTSARLALVSSAGDPGRGDLRVWAEAVTADAAERYSFTLRVVGDGLDEGAAVTLQVTGRHQVDNALAAAAAALCVGVSLDVVSSALSAAGPRSRWRMEIGHRPDGVTVVNDAYNANPDSMRAALGTAARLLRSARTDHADASLFVVLGDMLELGAEAPARHTEVGRLAAESGASLVLGIGEHADRIVAGAAAGGVDALRVASREEALQQLSDLRPGDVVLVKASRLVGLEAVASSLLGDPC
mgnify:CR=1 FL=1